MLSLLQADNSTDIVVGVLYFLGQQDAGLMEAVSEELCAIKVNIVPYTREQFIEDAAKQQQLADIQANFGGAAPSAP